MSNFTIGSLFDGSGTAPLAATILGMSPVWASEIEPFPIAVTKARFPKMKHLGDISKINGAEIEPVNVIVGGSPCTDLSVAGKQLGLQDGKQSHLFYEMTRIVREMRDATHGTHPRFVIWENVPGAFSSNKGEDFRAVVEEFCRIADDTVHISRPAKWRNAGSVVGNGWSFAWRVIDAKHWGVPQRRRRIYAILDLGSERAGEILFERTGLLWNTEPCGEKGQVTPTDVMGCADRGAGVVGAFCAGAAPAAGSIGYSERVAPTLKAGQCAFPMGAVVYDARGNGDGEVSATLTGDHQNRVTDYTAIVCGAFQNTGHGWWNEGATAQTLRTPCGGDSIKANLIVEKSRRHIVRRLTPNECARLQGFPVWWTDGIAVSNPTEKDIEFWTEAWETYRKIMNPKGKPKTRKQIVKWLRDPGSDSNKYKMWGNGMALPCVLAILNGIVDSEGSTITENV